MPFEKTITVFLLNSKYLSLVATFRGYGTKGKFCENKGLMLIRNKKIIEKTILPIENGIVNVN